MEGLLVFIAVLVGLPALLFSLLPIIGPRLSFQDSMEPRTGRNRYKLSQLIVPVIICALLFSVPVVNAPGISLMVAGSILFGVFLRAWQNEFVFLMRLRDDEFPGRHDKLIWVVVLLAFAPVGPWFFRSYRLAQSNEPVDSSQLDPAGTRAMAAQPA